MDSKGNVTNNKNFQFLISLSNQGVALYMAGKGDVSKN
jgi:hypothetical protein